MEEPLGSRILVGYDNAHEDQAGRMGVGGRYGWSDRGGRKGDGAKEEEEVWDEVVVSADGWVGGLFCHI